MLLQHVFDNLKTNATGHCGHTNRPIYRIAAALTLQYLLAQILGSNVF